MVKLTNNSKRDQIRRLLNFQFGTNRTWISIVLMVVVVLPLIGPRSISAFVPGQSAARVIGQPDFASDGFSHTPNGLWNPTDVAFDPSGNLWVADELNCRVLEYAPPFATGQTALISVGQVSLSSNSCSVSQDSLWDPYALAFDSKGDLWVDELASCRVVEYTSPFSSHENASIVIGEPDFSTAICGVGGDTQSGLSDPQGVTFDLSGNLWVSDQLGDRLLEFVPPFVNGENASLVLGQPSFSTFGCATTRNGLCYPESIKFDRSGSLWVADIGNKRVLRFDPPFQNDESASLVLGQSDFAARQCSLTSNGFCGPSSLSFDESGNLWIVDQYNDRVLEFVPPFRSAQNATLVIGQPNFTTNNVVGCYNGAANPSGFCSPAGVVFDLNGNIWIADQNNNRVLEFLNPRPPAALSVSDFFTTPSLNRLANDTTGDPSLDVILHKGVVRITSPPQILAWANITNISRLPLQSFKLNETLPTDWMVGPAHISAVGAIQVFYANTTRRATSVNNRHLGTVIVSPGNPEQVQLTIPNFNATSIGHPLSPGQSILLAIRLDYALDGTPQSFTSYPRSYTDIEIAAGWTNTGYAGQEASGASSASFTAYARVSGDVNGDGHVDIIDLVQVARSFGSRPNDDNWNISADLNKDGIIDIVDITAIGANFGS